MRKFLPALVVILVLAAAALGANQFLKNINVTRQAQNNLPTLPVLKIADTSLALTPEGSVVATHQNLPVLYLPGESHIALGQTVSDHVVIFATKLASLLAKTDFPPATIRVITEREIVVYDARELTAVFTAEKEANLQVDSLQQTLAAAKISEASLREDGDKITKIDLRFGKPVVTFK